jgi:hypothetical protein
VEARITESLTIRAVSVTGPRAYPSRVPPLDVTCRGLLSQAAGVGDVSQGIPIAGPSPGRNMSRPAVACLRLLTHGMATQAARSRGAFQDKPSLSPRAGRATRRQGVGDTGPGHTHRGPSPGRQWRGPNTSSRVSRFSERIQEGEPGVLTDEPKICGKRQKCFSLHRSAPLPLRHGHRGSNSKRKEGSRAPASAGSRVECICLCLTHPSPGESPEK